MYKCDTSSIKINKLKLHKKNNLNHKKLFNIFIKLNQIDQLDSLFEFKIKLF